MADISRSEVSTLIQEAYSSVLLEAVGTNSVALSSFRTVSMGTKTQNMPVLATLPEAGFVAESATESEGVKPTADVTWGNKQLVAEEIAVIVPVHENVVDDATEDILTQISTEAGAAIGRKLDKAILFGTDKPASWTSQHLTAAATPITLGTAQQGKDLAGCFLKAAEAVDEAGWDPSLIIGSRGLRYRLANLRDANGVPVWQANLSGGPGNGAIQGITAALVAGRVWDKTVTEGLVVDASRIIIGVRQDITVKVLTEATVGGINLAERDMMALRFKARYAYVLGNTTNSQGDAPQSPVAKVVASGS